MRSEVFPTRRVVVTAFEAIVIPLVGPLEDHGQFTGARVAIRDRLVAAVRTPPIC